MNRSLSVAVLAASPTSLRSAATTENPLARLVRARRLARAESDAARIALMREGLVDPARLPGGSPRIAISSDYDVLRQIR